MAQPQDFHPRVQAQCPQINDAPAACLGSVTSAFTAPRMPSSSAFATFRVPARTVRPRCWSSRTTRLPVAPVAPTTSTFAAAMSGQRSFQHAPAKRPANSTGRAAKAIGPAHRFDVCGRRLTRRCGTRHGSARRIVRPGSDVSQRSQPGCCASDADQEAAPLDAGMCTCLLRLRHQYWSHRLYFASCIAFCL